MTTRIEFLNKWKKKEPIERRARLNELAAQGYDTLDENRKREHDALAAMVADDEEISQQGA